MLQEIRARGSEGEPVGSLETPYSENISRRRFLRRATAATLSVIALNTLRNPRLALVQALPPEGVPTEEGNEQPTTTGDQTTSDSEPGVLKSDVQASDDLSAPTEQAPIKWETSVYAPPAVTVDAAEKDNLYQPLVRPMKYVGDNPVKITFKITTAISNFQRANPDNWGGGIFFGNGLPDADPRLLRGIVGYTREAWWMRFSRQNNIIDPAYDVRIADAPIPSGLLEILLNYGQSGSVGLADSPEETRAKFSFPQSLFSANGVKSLASAVFAQQGCSTTVDRYEIATRL